MISGTLAAGVIGTNGYIFTIRYSDIPEVVQAVEEFQYFEILGHKLDMSLSPQIATYYDGVAVYRPLNYILGESGSSTAPTSSQGLMELPGAVWLQYGASNKGRWFPSTSKQVYSTRTSTATAQPAGNFIFYVNNVGSVETIGGYNLYVNIRFYGTQYSVAN